jgi:hypothetical protein
VNGVALVAESTGVTPQIQGIGTDMNVGLALVAKAAGAISFTNSGSSFTLGSSGGSQVGTPTGGDKGAGTLNIQGTIWTNGTQGIASKTCTVNQNLTLIFTNGILTGGTCNS